MNHRPAYILTSDNNLSMVVNGKSYFINTSHPNYSRIIDAIKADRFEGIEELINIPKAINEYYKGGVEVRNGKIYYKGNVVHNTLTRRIMEFINKGLPTGPLLKFFSNLMSNPSARSINELYGFLEHKGFPITDDGCFLAYKGVNQDYTDCYSGKFDNSVGVINEVERNQVDDNSEKLCSFGFHVGTYAYANSFAKGNLVLVKVNPKDAVSVPNDHSADKLRVCKYQVISVVSGMIEEPYCPSSQEDCEEYDDYEG